MSEDQEQPREPDRLERAVMEKSIKCEIAERPLVLTKWTLRQGMRVSGKIATVIRDAMPSGNVADLMQADIETIVTDHQDDFVEILAVSVQSNFESEAEALEWIEGLSLEDAIELFSFVGRLNLRPLLLAVSKLGSVIGNGENAGLSQQMAAPSRT